MSEFKRYNESILLAEPIRLSFPKVWEAKPLQLSGGVQGKICYSTAVAIHESQEAVIEQINAVVEKLGAKSWPEGPPANFKHPLKLSTDPVLEGYYTLNAYADPDRTPEIYTKNNDNKVVLTDNRALIYSGAEAHIFLGFYTFQTSATQLGVGTGLNKIMVTGSKAPAFGGLTGEQVFGGVVDSVKSEAEAEAPPADLVEENTREEPAQKPASRPSWRT